MPVYGSEENCPLMEENGIEANVATSHSRHKNFEKVQINYDLSFEKAMQKSLERGFACALGSINAFSASDSLFLRANLPFTIKSE
jgi:hypothetical protein